jgi:hypothetical protein
VSRSRCPQVDATTRERRPTQKPQGHSNSGIAVTAAKMSGYFAGLDTIEIGGKKPKRIAFIGGPFSFSRGTLSVKITDMKEFACKIFKFKDLRLTRFPENSIE